ncbi:MAG: hypothetical protein NVSMB64_13320 [Candidatus Velthaea sp.]
MRSLILAGGGLKVAYQAGCLQVFDELKLTFDHVDAASGGCFNAAMLASGMTGTQIANHWRTMSPGAFTTLDWTNYYKLIWNRSVGTSDGVRNVLRNIWQLDYGKINTPRTTRYTFNHYDFTNKRVAIVENTALDEDTLVASTSLMGWLPSVQKPGGKWIFDAAWCTDGNVGEAVRRGADEIWAIWTLSNTPELRDGVLAQYFHVIESIGNAKFLEEWDEIAAVNAAITAHGGPIKGRGPDLQLRAGYDPTATATMLPPEGRVFITQHLIRQEVPMHYLFIFSRDRVAAAVEMGVRDACDYARSIGLLPPSACFPSAQPAQRVPSVEFRETMRGFFMPGEPDPKAGEKRGRQAGNAMTVVLTIETRNLDSFLHQPEHRATATGTVDCPLLCGEPMPVTAGTFQLFVNDREGGITQPGRKRMLYDVEFNDPRGTRFRLRGKKLVREGKGFTLWPDTTTLYLELCAQDSASGQWRPYGAGVIHVLFADFLKELTTFRAPGATGVRAKAAALGRFGRFWAGSAWDVYARGILDYAPF